MFIQKLRRSLQRSEGQALVLACLTVLVLSIAVITTVNVGHAVHEKIRLQNNVDAAAYSMAAIEARAFNFYAFVNRTQVSHYVSAMTWQSVISVMFFAEAFVTDIWGMLRTLNPCADPPWWAELICEALEFIPIVGPILRVIDQIFGIIERFVVTFQNIMKRTAWPLDSVIGRRIIPLHRLLNNAMYAAQMGMMASAGSHLATASTNIMNANDANANPGWGVLLTGALSACMFGRIHHGGSMKANPMAVLDPAAVEEDSKVARAKRSMGAVTNATRFQGQDGAFTSLEKFNTNRTLGELMPLPEAARDLINIFLGENIKVGQTRFLSSMTRRNRGQLGERRNLIRDSRTAQSYPFGPLGQGDNLGADDIYRIEIGPLCDSQYWKCWGDPRDRNISGQDSATREQFKTSVWALNETENRWRDGGVHWRLLHRFSRPRHGNRQRGPNGPRNDANKGLNRHGVGPFDLFKVYTANVRPLEDGNHPWRGLAPFMHFEPGDFANACPAVNAQLNRAATREHEFNQPSTWAALNKASDELRNDTEDGTGATRNTPALLNDEGRLQFNFTSAGQELDLENNETGLLTEGMTAIARGQTYYHRPGNWAEQPNFFNPYWRPRLASVYQGMYTFPLVENIVTRLPSQVSSFPQKIITH